MRAVLVSKIAPAWEVLQPWQRVLVTGTQHQVQMGDLSIFRILALPSRKLLDVSEVAGLSDTDTCKSTLTYSFHSGLAEFRNSFAVPLSCNQLHFSFRTTEAAFCGNACVGV